MALRQRVARTLVGTLILVAACVSVGLTAPADAPFTIAVRPVFLRLDANAIAESRARALGLDVDVKVGTWHLHFGWSVIPLASQGPPEGGRYVLGAVFGASATTKSARTLL